MTLRPLRCLPACFFLMLLAACTALQWPLSAGPEIIKSANDSRSYRYLALPNQLKVLLISDASAERAAASLDVHVGNRYDPPGYNGLAHFLEHMLFLGTEKYPRADEYQQFISAHGGSHNAYTSFEHTNYFFDINNPHLADALDRFADFFISPTFDAAYIERERNAVESEFRARYANEYRRILDATREVINPAHPFANFTTGNLQTLAHDDIRDRLLAFYKQHYSASRMTLAVTGAYSLDQLESMVRARFAAIANNGSTVQPVRQPLLAPQTGTAATLLAVQTKKPLRQLHLSFPLPELKPYEPHKPLSYIGNILGHEGERSLLSMLKAAGLAESISAGIGIEYSGGALYQLNLVLTADGIKAVDDVVAMVMHSIAVLQRELEQQPQRARQRFAEQRQLSEMAFRFIEQGTPVHTAIAASANLQRYAPGKVLYGAYEFAAFDAALISKLLASLAPSNMLVTLASNELPATLAPRQRSRWYQVDYSVVPVSGDWQRRWQAAYTGQGQVGAAAGRTAQLMASGFALPAANPFIASDFTLHAGSGPIDAAPQQVARVAGLEVWRKIDDEFELPKLDARIAFLSSYPAASPRRQALANLYALVVGEQLKEYIYPAYLAGMQASFYPNLRGYSLRVSGYNDGLQPLLERLLQSMGQLRISERRFGELSAELERNWALAMQATPHNRLGSYLNSELYTDKHDYPALINALRPLRYSDLQQFIASFWPTAYWQVLLHGNIDERQTDAITAMLAGAALPRCACSKPPAGVAIRQLPPGQQVLALQLDHADRALQWYFQAADDSLRTAAMAMLSADILHPLMFNALRTEQQLGYIVQASYHALHKWPGVALSMQSPAYSEAELAAATASFIQGFIQQPVSAGVFERHRNALLARLQEDDPNLRARTARYWRSLMFDELDFDHRARLAAEMASIDHASWLAQLDSLLGRSARSLQVRTQPN